MPLLLAALVLAAAPDLKAATSCMEAAEGQHAACVQVARGFVPAAERAEAGRRCANAYHRALEHCLTANGIAVTEAQRQAWRGQQAVSEALSACFGHAENDFQWCAARAGEPAGVERCRSVALRAFDGCTVERDRQQAALAAGTGAAPLPKP